MRYLTAVCVAALLAAPLVAEPSQCKLEDVLKDARQKLEGLKPKVQGQKSYYAWTRDANGEITVNRKELLTGYARREVPIAIFNPKGCVVRVERPWHEVRSQLLTDPQGVLGLQLEAAPLAYWNGKNTAFAPSDPAEVVVGELWKPYGKESKFYVPHSMRLQRAFPEVVARGTNELDAGLDRAEAFLLDKSALSSEDTRRLKDRMRRAFRSEQIDPNAFRAASPSLQEELVFKADAQMYLNGREGLVDRTSSADAAGPAQVIPSTCAVVRKDLPKARFWKDCNGAEGLDRQAASLAAGMWVLKLKEDELIPIFGKDAVYGSWGDVVVGVAYHSGSYITRKAIQAYGKEWIKVHTETVRKKTKKGHRTVVVRESASLGPQGSLYARKLMYLTKFERDRTISVSLGGG